MENYDINFDKEYIGVLKMGQVTTTGDSQGKIYQERDYKDISEEKVKDAFSRFEGEIDQVPPMVSAVRIGGKRLYRLARKGVTIQSCWPVFPVLLLFTAGKDSGGDLLYC